jgi:hypothetical protein
MNGRPRSSWEAGGDDVLEIQSASRYNGARMISLTFPFVNRTGRRERDPGSKVDQKRI